MSDSDYGSDVEQLSAGEIERRRRKNKKKKESKKQNKRNRQHDVSGADDQEEPTVVEETNGHAANGVSAEENGSSVAAAADDDGLEVEIEYVSEDPIISADDPAFSQFAKIFDTFKVKSEDAKSAMTFKTSTAIDDDLPTDENGAEHTTKAAISERILQDEMDQRRKEAEEAGEAEKLSRRKLRLSMQPSIAVLKATTGRPDVVEWADVTSRDPNLLVELKAYRNTVMVPRHWNAKRKYLAGKRGFERPPFDLPDFIKRTGIMEMRETMWEKEDAQSLKSKMRERTRPKMGRIDIDYQKLHDAFFRWQTKPAMSRMGELYYEGKEQEAQMREKKPGQLSDDLRISLGMPVGPNCQKFPPPWLIAMQRYGPPPSYPNLKIAGLNAPIPEGCAFGYHAGGWGKPPVDEYGKPLYGDVFGMLSGHTSEQDDESRIERRHWGEIGSDEGSSDEESDADGEEEEEGGVPPPPESGFTTPATTEGFATPSGITTIPGAETPESIELRKRKGAESSAGGDTPAALYSVLPEKKVDRFGGQLMGSSHVYDLSRKINVASDGVEVSLNPEELDMADQYGLERKYEEQLRKQTQIRHENTEDFSDMVAEQNARVNRKRKVTDQKKTHSSSSGGGGGGGTQSSQKKYKDFKF